MVGESDVASRRVAGGGRKGTTAPAPQLGRLNEGSGQEGQEGQATSTSGVTSGGAAGGAQRAPAPRAMSSRRFAWQQAAGIPQRIPQSAVVSALTASSKYMEGVARWTQAESTMTVQEHDAAKQHYRTLVATCKFDKIRDVIHWHPEGLSHEQRQALILPPTMIPGAIQASMRSTRNGTVGAQHCQNRWSVMAKSRR